MSTEGINMAPVEGAEWQGETRLLRIAPQEIEHVWDLVKVDLEACIALQQGEITLEQARLMVIQGNITLVVIAKPNSEILMTIAVTVEQAAQYSTLSVFAAAGERVKYCFEKHWNDLAMLAKSFGCKFIEVHATTEAHARLYTGLGFKKNYLNLRREV
ncbi:hypothetical protein UFOVP435_15 [uncultured Caudovirales phage]|uniref:Uncharacterized protein n=1 Tax=uncultured Caudovirales phage TaxID=2100421 RepID=A0A6J5MC39_9CAUD|nr:hypothetical protein UFOVP435_15 [uncultured Caudovirales phage]